MGAFRENPSAKTYDIVSGKLGNRQRKQPQADLNVTHRWQGTREPGFFQSSTYLPER